MREKILFSVVILLFSVVVVEVINHFLGISFKNVGMFTEIIHRGTYIVLGAVVKKMSDWAFRA